MSSDSPRLEQLIQAAAEIIRENAEEVAGLDQAIGDGDHVTNLQRGLDALLRSAAEWESLDWPTRLQKTGMSLMSTIGGASGSLYGTLFIAMSKALRDREMSAGSMATAFAQGVEAVKQRGKADLGEKTMLDVLIPVSKAWLASVEEDKETAATLDAINRAAASGCNSTAT